MLAYIASNGARTIIVETASRFARDLMVQEVGFAKLQALGIKLVAADSPSLIPRRHAHVEADPADTRRGLRVRQGDGRCQAQGRQRAQARAHRREGRGPEEPCRATAGACRPGPPTAPQEAEGRPTITAGHLSRACAARPPQRAWSAVLGGVDQLDAPSSRRFHFLLPLAPFRVPGFRLALFSLAFRCGALGGGSRGGPSGSVSVRSVPCMLTCLSAWPFPSR